MMSQSDLPLSFWGYALETAAFTLNRVPSKSVVKTPYETLVKVGDCWKYALESTGFDPLVGSDGFDPLWCKSPNGPQML
jgi:hypothetical protein